jgi:hypothetical protein
VFEEREQIRYAKSVRRTQGQLLLPQFVNEMAAPKPCEDEREFILRFESAAQLFEPRCHVRSSDLAHVKRFGERQQREYAAQL